MAFRSALTRDPKQHDAYYNLGLLLAKRAFDDDAIATFQRGLALFPGSINLMTILGIVYQRKGEVALAQSTFRKLTEVHPENGDAFLFLGSSYLESGDHKRAVNSLLNAERRMGPNPRVQYLLGLVYAYLGDPSQSAAHLQRAITLDPKLCFAHYELAKLELGRGDLESASRLSKAAAACDGGFTPSRTIK